MNYLKNVAHCMCFSAVLLLVSFSAQAEKVIRLQGFSIEGGSEEPNVLYVTPWSPPPGTGRLFAPMKSYRDQWLRPISRQVLRREVIYSQRNKRTETKK